jgi:hypothetical protein
LRQHESAPGKNQQQACAQHASFRDFSFHFSSSRNRLKGAGYGPGWRN